MVSAFASVVAVAVGTVAARNWIEVSKLTNHTGPKENSQSSAQKDQIC